MGKSLLDQLKNTGLVDKKQANKVKHEQYKNKKQKAKKNASAGLDEARRLALKAQAEKVDRDRRINLENNKAAEQKAIAAQIVQLIETNRVADYEGDITYNFTDANVVKRLFVSEKIRQHLVAGKLAIAKLGEHYELVPRGVAEKIQQRDANCIIQNEAPGEPQTDEEDPYADYEIPDDLMW